jgi:WD40 repeat protein
MRDSSFNGKQLLIGNSLWDVATGNKLQQFSLPDGHVPAATFSPDGRQALTAVDLETGQLMFPEQSRLWDIASGREIGRFGLREGGFYDVMFNPDGTRLLATDGSGDLTIIDVQTGRQLLEIGGFDRSDPSLPLNYSAGFSPDGRSILLLSWRKITVWDSSAGKQVSSIKEEGEPTKSGCFSSTQFSPDGKLILTEQNDGLTTVWNAITGQQVRVFAGGTIHNGPCATYALFLPAGREVISGSHDGIALLWNVESGNEIRRFQTPGPRLWPVSQMIVSSDGKRLITRCGSTRDDNVVGQIEALWDVESGRLLKQFGGPETIVGFSPVDETFITTKNGKPYELWDGATGKIIRKYQLDTDKLQVAGASPSNEGHR